MRQLAAISVAVDAQIPIMFLGPPGTGKTQSMYAIGRAKNRPVYTVITSLREPTDLNGLPYQWDGTVKIAPPLWAQLAQANKGIVFFDECTWAAPRVQAAMLRLVNEKMCGELAMPDVSFVLAGNPVGESGGGYEISGPLANRLLHMTWENDESAWIEGMMNGWPDPAIPLINPDWRDHLHEARVMLATYIKSATQRLLITPENESQWSQAWPSPRSWDMVAQLDAACTASGINGEVQGELFRGAVGTGPALEYITWRKDLDMPDPEIFLANPEAFTLPKRRDKAFVVLTSVASAVTRRLTVARWNAGWAIMAKAAEQGAIDSAGAAAKQLALNRPKGAMAPKEAAIFLPLFEAAGLFDLKGGK